MHLTFAEFVTSSELRRAFDWIPTFRALRLFAMDVV
jgi:hypothetical protein